MRGGRSSEPGRWLILPRLSSQGLLLLLLVAAAWPAAAQVPRFETDGGGMAWLRDLPPLLVQPEVRKKLDTGLTTSFEFKLEGGGEQRIFALFDVRFEPWDEIYEVAWVDRRGQFERLKISSFEQLAEYWRTLRLAAGKLPPAAGGRSEKLRLLVELVPFRSASRTKPSAGSRIRCRRPARAPPRGWPAPARTARRRSARRCRC
jgi:hypothetical protein